MLRRTHPRTATLAQGFTLIEVMIVVAVIGILSSIAYPSYTEYVLRGKITEATATLQNLQADMERHFQNYRTYASKTLENGTNVINPCTDHRDVSGFQISCFGANENGYQIEAKGNKFTFTINQRDEKTSQEYGKNEQKGCWIMGRGKTC